jgi:DNA mismatch repair protein MSH6
LYENDAEIGHAEFDLKLTDRVKMKMVSTVLGPKSSNGLLKNFGNAQVGVPETSFDFWAAKFLAAGYKVGKVEQAETAIG